MYRVLNYECSQCGVFGVLHDEDKSPKTSKCKCGKRAARTWMKDKVKRANPSSPFYSKACGIHPSQIDEMCRANPDHEFNPDGDMLIKNYQHQKKVTDQLGMALY